MMIYPNNLSSKKEDPIYLLVPQPHAFRNKEESQRPQAKMEKKELILLLKGSAAVVCRSDGRTTNMLFVHFRILTSSIYSIDCRPLNNIPVLHTKCIHGI